MKYEFCHIPKTGGKSIKKALNITKKGKHIPKSKFNHNFLFTFVRDPFTRLISTFFFLKKGGINKLDMGDKKKFIKNKSFKEFVLDGSLDKAIENKQQHLLPQSYYLPNGAHFIGRFENLEKDFEDLKKKINKPKANLPHLNKTDYPSPENLYNEEMVKKVTTIYSEDFINFNYSKILF